MEEILTKAQPIIDGVSQFLVSLTIIATLLAKVINKGKHQAEVGSLAHKLLGFLHKLPTFGIHPHTKKLEEQLKELQNEPVGPES